MAALNAMCRSRSVFGISSKTSFLFHIIECVVTEAAKNMPMKVTLDALRWTSPSRSARRISSSSQDGLLCWSPGKPWLPVLLVLLP